MHNRLNYYITTKDKLLNPCEMPQQKVIHFLNNYKTIWLHEYLRKCKTIFW